MGYNASSPPFSSGLHHTPEWRSGKIHGFGIRDTWVRSPTQQLISYDLGQVTSTLQPRFAHLEKQGTKIVPTS